MNIFFKFLAAATVATMTIPAIAADDSSNDYISSNPFETMIRLGRVKGNRMVNMQLSNRKLVDRGTRMLVDELGLPYEEAQALLLRHGSVRKALDAARTDRPLTSSPETRNHNY